MDELDDTTQFSEETGEAIIIKAVGVGGGGNNAVDHMYRQGISNVSFVNINTDRQTLRHSAVPERIVIGNGMGAGNDPNVARNAAENSAEAIARIFDDDTKMVFITAGMGGGTGTGAAPVVARIAKEKGLLTIGIVTIPFLFEGQKKIVKALEGADEMSKHVDALLVINNERLTEIYPDLDFDSGFAKADDTLSTAARSISELITCVGRINLDFNDVNSTLRDGGAAIISTGYGEGENRVTKAIEDALNSPLLKNRDIFGSQKLLFNIYFSREATEKFRMEETNELTEFVNNIDKGVDVIWGVAYDDTLGDKVKITILAAGFDVSLSMDVEEGLGRRPAAPSRPKMPVRTPEKPAISFGPTPATARAAAPASDSSEQAVVKRIGDEYGREKVLDKARTKYIILTPDKFDDDEVIEVLETTPTHSRDKRLVDKLRSSETAAPRVAAGNRPASGAGESRIEF